MRPIRSGDRGPAVEDIQRRLLTLGFELGRTGIDGVFLGRTLEAVRAFQRAQGIDEDGLVGDATWSALVDATFTLGDRALYLRLPHFHGRDVRLLQEALNALGFACGQADSIFGAFTERAVREFQSNAGLPADGIVGPKTVGALTALRHVWEGKDPRSHSAARTGPVRESGKLEALSVALRGADSTGVEIAARALNVAQAATARTGVKLLAGDEPAPSGTLAVLDVVADGTASAIPGRPVARGNDAQELANRLATAVAAAEGHCPEVTVEIVLVSGEREESLQKAAVMLLDAACIAFD